MMSSQWITVVRLAWLGKRPIGVLMLRSTSGVNRHECLPDPRHDGMFGMAYGIATRKKIR